MFYSESVCKVAEKLQVSEIVDHPAPSSNQHQVFKFENVPPCVINAIRRTMIRYSPSMRIDDLMEGHEHNILTISEKVFAHRLGMIRVATNPFLFLYEDEITTPHPFTGKVGAKFKAPDYRPRYEAEDILTGRIGYGNPVRPNKPEEDTHFAELPEYPDEYSCLVFKIDITCTWNEEKKCLEYETVYGKDLEWIPYGTQLERLTAANAIPKINPNIVIAELSEGERIQMYLYAVKSQGAEHTKWRPNNARFVPLQLFPEDPTRNCYEFHIETLEPKTNPKFYLLDAVRELRERFQALANACTVTK